MRLRDFNCNNYYAVGQLLLPSSRIKRQDSAEEGEVFLIEECVLFEFLDHGSFKLFYLSSSVLSLYLLNIFMALALSIYFKFFLNLMLK